MIKVKVIKMVVGTSVRCLEVHVTRFLVFDGIDPFEKSRKADVDTNDRYRGISDKYRHNVRDHMVAAARVIVRLCPLGLPVLNRSVIPVIRDGVFFDLFLRKGNRNEFSVIVTRIVNTFLTVGNAGNVKRVMNICTLDKIIVLGHETDKVICVIDDMVTQFTVFRDRLNVRDLVPGPSGKGTDGVLYPEELGIKVIAALLQEQVHL